MPSFESTALRLAAVPAALSVIVALAGCSHIKAAFQPPDSSPPAHIVHLSDEQQQGVIAKQDYLRLVKIQEGINRTQKVSDEDVAFIAQQLNGRPVQDTSNNARQAQHLILDHTYGSGYHPKPKRLTPSQRSRLFNAILPYTSSSDQWVQVDASLALAGTRDPRAVKVLEQMAQSSQYRVVRLDAKVWLKSLKEVGVTSEKTSQ